MDNYVLALDQSTQITGWAIFDNKTKELKKYGKVAPSGNDVIKRIIILRDWIKNIIEKENIQQLVIEEIQLQNIPGTSREGNVATFKKLAYVQAIILELAIDLNIPCEIISSSTWKSYCGIKGAKRPEQKRNAQIYIEKTYGVKPTQDECDAICIGRTYCFSREDNDEGFNWED